MADKLNEKIVEEATNINIKKKKFGEKLRENIQKILILIVSVVYISQGLFSLSKKEATFYIKSY